MHGATFRICCQEKIEQQALRMLRKPRPTSIFTTMSWIARFEGVASPRQVISYNFPISALFPITSDGEILSHLNHLATPALGKSFAVEIKASRDNKVAAWCR